MVNVESDSETDISFRDLDFVEKTSYAEPKSKSEKLDLSFLRWLVVPKQT